MPGGSGQDEPESGEKHIYARELQLYCYILPRQYQWRIDVWPKAAYVLDTQIYRKQPIKDGLTYLFRLLLRKIWNLKKIV